eukprot:6466543-Prymnesium_polylepis.1
MCDRISADGISSSTCRTHAGRNGACRAYGCRLVAHFNGPTQWIDTCGLTAERGRMGAHAQGVGATVHAQTVRARPCAECVVGREQGGWQGRVRRRGARAAHVPRLKR